MQQHLSRTNSLLHPSLPVAGSIFGTCSGKPPPSARSLLQPASPLRLVYASCWVPWHSSMRCEEYQNMPTEERNIEDITLYQLAESSNWRCCQQCRQMIELADGCYHNTYRCGHEFCFSCGVEFKNGAQISHCKMWDESSESSPASSEHKMEPWRWDRFNLLPATIDGYSQEKSQLAVIQRFIAGDISLDNRDHCHSSSCSSYSYQDTIKDHNQLPWLESCFKSFERYEHA